MVMDSLDKEFAVHNNERHDELEKEFNDIGGSSGTAANTFEEIRQSKLERL